MMKPEDRFARVYDYAVAHRESSTRDAYPQLDDGGSWYRCPSCGRYKRFVTVDGSEAATRMCATCERPTRHEPDRPSYACDG